MTEEVPYVDVLQRLNTAKEIIYTIRQKLECFDHFMRGEKYVSYN